MMLKNKAIALVTVLIFIILLLLTVGAVVGIMTSQARLTEHQIRRIRAYYTAQAGLEQALEDLRRNPGAPGPWSGSENNLNYSVTFNPLNNTTESSVDYTRSF